jgi:hypothetical protein
MKYLTLTYWIDWIPKFIILEKKGKLRIKKDFCFSVNSAKMYFIMLKLLIKKMFDAFHMNEKALNVK